MSYPFGKSFKRWFYPIIDGESPDGVLTSQNPAIYIFRDQPGREAAQSGTGALQTIGSWTWSATDAGWYYNVAAINDPDPISTTHNRIFWEAVNFRVESGAQIQTDVRAFYVERVAGLSHNVSVSETDLKEYFPQLDSISTPAQREQQIVLAVEDIKARLKNKGFEWARIHRVDRLNIAIAHRVLYMLMLIQVQQGNDKYAIKYTEFKAIFDTTIESLVMEYDSNKDGLPDAQVTQGSGPIRIIR
jgi:hypothetical protein